MSSKYTNPKVSRVVKACATQLRRYHMEPAARFGCGAQGCVYGTSDLTRVVKVSVRTKDYDHDASIYRFILRVGNKGNWHLPRVYGMHRLGDCAGKATDAYVIIREDLYPIPNTPGTRLAVRIVDRMLDQKIENIYSWLKKQGTSLDRLDTLGLHIITTMAHLTVWLHERGLRLNDAGKLANLGLRPPRGGRGVDVVLRDPGLIWPRREFREKYRTMWTQGRHPMDKVLNGLERALEKLPPVGLDGLPLR